MELFVALVLLVIYFIPTIISFKKQQGCAIGVLNLFLGWTLIGWIVALVWACCNDTKITICQQSEQPKQNKYDELEKLADLKNKGIISESEFENKKNEILGNNTTEYP